MFSKNQPCYHVTQLEKIITFYIVHIYTDLLYNDIIIVDTKHVTIYENTKRNKKTARQISR